MSSRIRSPEEGGEVDFQTAKNKCFGATKIVVDNSWVLPHSPDLLRKFGTHMNAELFISRVGSIKYLLKYVCKGQNRVTAEVVVGDTDETGRKTSEGAPTIDEMRHYQDARYISTSEAACRLFSFPIMVREPTVE